MRPKIRQRKQNASVTIAVECRDKARIMARQSNKTITEFVETLIRKSFAGMKLSMEQSEK
jgi:hypothetical protein